jgi:hypothetical protein
MKKVLHASNKLEDPMRVFTDLIQGVGRTQGFGAVTGPLPPQRLKEGLQTLGLNQIFHYFHFFFAIIVIIIASISVMITVTITVMNKDVE